MSESAKKVSVNPKLAEAIEILRNAGVPGANFLHGILFCPPEKLPAVLVAYLTAESARIAQLSLVAMAARSWMEGVFAARAGKHHESQLTNAGSLAHAALTEMLDTRDGCTGEQETEATEAKPLLSKPPPNENLAKALDALDRLNGPGASRRLRTIASSSADNLPEIVAAYLASIEAQLTIDQSPQCGQIGVTAPTRLIRVRDVTIFAGMAIEELAMANEGYVIQFRNGLYLHSLEGSIMDGLEKARIFASPDEAEACCRRTPWIDGQGGKVVPKSRAASTKGEPG